MPPPTPCPLCQTPHAAGAESVFFQAQTGPFREQPRTYFRCGTCWLIFTAPSQRLSPQAEKAEYDRHQNGPADLGYRRFLSRLFDALQPRLAPGSQGLDFGSGPGPTLSVMFEEVGHRVALYDRFYAPDAAVLQASYDFVTASEVVEHLHDPGLELARLWRCLKPGGWLGMMTKLARDRDAFATWHYKDDPTHICFFSRQTFQWLGQGWGSQLIVVGDDVILLQKPEAEPPGLGSLISGPG